MQGIEDINSEINETINRTYRFACFTQSKTNLPMWNHYANGHKGVCLEYDTTEINNIININALPPRSFPKTEVPALNTFRPHPLPQMQLPADSRCGTGSG